MVWQNSGICKWVFRLVISSVTTVVVLTIIAAVLMNSVAAEGKSIAAGVGILVLTALVGIAVIVGVARAVAQRLATSLQSLVMITRQLAGGNPEVEPEMEAGNDELGTLQRSLGELARFLKRVVITAEAIAEGKVEVEVHVKDDQDRLNGALARMVEALRRKVEQIEEITRGDLRTEVQINSPHDRLGIAIRDMVNDLRRMAEIARRIAEGDLTVEVAPRS
ncbi:MAG: HAMP domain-containing protein, partial [Calditrichaeota bacterium]